MLGGRGACLQYRHSGKLKREDRELEHSLSEKGLGSIPGEKRVWVG